IGLAAGPAVAAQDTPLRELKPPRALRPTEAPRPSAQPPYDGNVQETQQRLHQLLEQYPPTLARVLALDPTLLGNSGYLQPYPALAQFLAQHPEIEHNHSYFFGQYREGGGQRDYNDPKLAAIREVGGALAGVGGLLAFLTVVSSIVWIIRTVIEH